VHPEWTHTPFIPYDRLLRHGRVATGKAVRIDTAERQVVLATGERLPYDVVVIATGADYPEPARFTGTTTEEAAKSFTEHQRNIATAGHVLVVGGGPGGVELSAEIRLARPDARVTLAHSGPALLDAEGSARPGRKALAWLESHDIEVRLDSFMSPGNDFGTYRDARGTVIEADLSFWATGTTPNTLWLRLAGHGDWLNTAGRVKVPQHPRLPAEFRQAPQGAAPVPPDPAHPAHRAVRPRRRTDRAARAGRRARRPRRPHHHPGQGEEPHDAVHAPSTRLHGRLTRGRPHPRRYPSVQPGVGSPPFPATD
jgi:hypothetical protein